jgi:hypothetical protein
LKSIQNPKNFVAGKGVKQVNQATCAETVTLVTKWCFIGAAGNTIPSAVVFPCVHLKQFISRVASPGTLGVPTHSGWKTSGSFVDVMKHFTDHTNSSKENISHVLLDNHERHLSH